MRIRLLRWTLRRLEQEAKKQKVKGRHALVTFITSVLQNELDKIDARKRGKRGHK